MACATQGRRPGSCKAQAARPGYREGLDLRTEGPTQMCPVLVPDLRSSSSAIRYTQALRPGLYNCRAFGPGFRRPQVLVHGLTKSRKYLAFLLMFF